MAKNMTNMKKKNILIEHIQLLKMSDVNESNEISYINNISSND